MGGIISINGDGLCVQRIELMLSRGESTSKNLALSRARSSYHARLARVNGDDSIFTISTEGDGRHTLRWSSDLGYLINTWSRVELTPLTV